MESGTYCHHRNSVDQFPKAFSASKNPLATACRCRGCAENSRSGCLNTCIVATVQCCENLYGSTMDVPCHLYVNPYSEGCARTNIVVTEPRSTSLIFDIPYQIHSVGTWFPVCGHDLSAQGSTYSKISNKTHGRPQLKNVREGYTTHGLYARWET